MSRFLFHASAFAVSGHITRPLDQFLDAKASSVLPTIGGRVSGSTGPFRLNDPTSGRLILSYDSADTSAVGEATPTGGVQTTVTSVIRNVNVLDVLKADEVDFGLVLTYSGGPNSVVDAGSSRFVNLTINGAPFDVAIDYAMAKEASDYNAFKAAHPELKESHGQILYSLARNPALQFGTEDFGFLDVPDFGRIYFAEWIASPDTQDLTMLRLQLGSPVGGAVAMGGGNGDGRTYP